MPEFETDGPGPAVHGGDHRPARRRRGSGARHAGTRAAPAATDKAVLHVHGFGDYFFQTAYAECWTYRGLRLLRARPAQVRPVDPRRTRRRTSSPTWREYFAELDEAYRRVTDRDGHDHVVVSAHSTGGLIMPLWADDRSPAAGRRWCSTRRGSTCRASLLLRTVGTKAINQLGARRPYAVIPRNVTGLYARACTRTTRASGTSTSSGSRGVLPRLRRLAAGDPARSRRGCTAVDVAAPVLVLTSGAQLYPPEMGERRPPARTSCSTSSRSAWAPSSAARDVVRIEGARTT